MKKIIQNIALLAFFGCVALVGISAPGKPDITCRQEWKAGFTTSNNLAEKNQAREKENLPVSKKPGLLLSPFGIMNFIWQ